MSRLEIVKEAGATQPLTAERPSKNQRSLFIVAVLGALFGAYLLIAQFVFVMKAQQVEGHVVARDEVNFTLKYSVAGHDYQISENLPSAKGFNPSTDLLVGNSAFVLYDPSAPEKAQWRSGRNWAFPTIIVIMSSLFALTILYPKILTGQMKFFRR